MAFLDTMWAALEKYQPHADKAGHGESWLKMTQERTSDAAWGAWDAAERAAAQLAADAAAWAVWTWESAEEDDAWSAAHSNKCAVRAIEHIDRAIMLEVKP